MNHSGSPSIRAIDVWDILRTAITTDLSIGLALKRLFPLNFYDEFNRSAEDTDIWTHGGDGGAFNPDTTSDLASTWYLITGNVIDNDEYIHGDGIYNKRFTPFEVGYTTVTWETRIRFVSIADISAFWGIFTAPPTDYEEDNTPLAQFLADPGISATFRARTWGAAEEETDTLVALDTDFHTFKIVWTATSVLFYIDNALVATHVTQVPGRPLTSALLIRTEAVASKYMYLDYVRGEMS